ncbi:MAG: hypothetical protein II743_09300 [Lachnospiraceae bacterium]|nr:hypothetical protein [Lachnospiraceae bacterium]
MINTMMDFMEHFFHRNLTLAVVIGIVLLARALLRKTPKKYVYALWAIVGVRMLFALPITTPISVAQYLPWERTQVSTGETLADQSVTVQSGEDLSVYRDHAEKELEELTRQESEALPVSTAEEKEFTPEGNADRGELASDSNKPVRKWSLKEISATGVFGLWLFGMITILGTGMVSYVRVKKRVGQAVLLQDNIWECDDIATPFVLGVIRPKIYIPFHLDEERKACILEHEKIHVAHGDPLVKLVAYLLLAIYWCNPFAWLAYVCFVRDQEMRCDEAVITRLGAERKKCYGETLLSFATEKHVLGYSPVAFGESDAERRIKNLLNYKKPSFWIVIVAIAVIVLVAVICLTTAKKGKQEENVESTTQQEQVDVKETEDWQTRPDLQADLDGDGEKETVSIKDHPSGKTLIQASLKDGKEIEFEMQGAFMITTEGVAADLDGDGREELVFLQSSLAGSTYNWPGKLTLLQFKDGAFEPMSDRLFYEHTNASFQLEGYPEDLSKGPCIRAKIEQSFEHKVLRLVYPLGNENMVCLDCTYVTDPEEGWHVERAKTYHDYLINQTKLGSTRLFGLIVGNDPIEDLNSSAEVPGNLYASLPEEFLFTSGAGGWSTTLHFQEDGSFQGTYRDFDAGAGDGIAWDVQICEFSGKCSAPKKINELAYSCYVEDLTFPETGRISVEGDTRYTTAQPYGLNHVERFILYLPGYPVSELPNEVYTWLNGSADEYWERYDVEILPFYVLYNINGGQAFSSPTIAEYVSDDAERRLHPYETERLPKETVDALTTKELLQALLQSSDIDVIYLNGEVDSHQGINLFRESNYALDAFLQREDALQAILEIEEQEGVVKSLRQYLTGEDPYAEKKEKNLRY